MSTNNSINLPDVTSGSPLAVEYIQTLTASTSADLNFALSSAYAFYFVVMNDLKPTDNNNKLNLLFSNDNGSTYLGSNQYARIGVQTAQDGGPSRFGSSSEVNIKLTEDVGVDATDGYGLNGQIWLYNPAVAKRLLAQWYCYWSGTGSTTRRFVHGWGDSNSNTGINRIKLEYDSTTIASGTIDIFGYKI